jgi:hypothetical protein
MFGLRARRGETGGPHADYDDMLLFPHHVARASAHPTGHFWGGPLVSCAGLGCVWGGALSRRRTADRFPVLIGKSRNSNRTQWGGFVASQSKVSCEGDRVATSTDAVQQERGEARSTLAESRCARGYVTLRDMNGREDGRKRVNDPVTWQKSFHYDPCMVYNLLHGQK